MRTGIPAARWSRKVAAGVLPLLLTAGLAAQDGHSARAPRLPGGAPVVLLPVQSAVPSTAAGVGAATAGRDAVDLLNAELVFAFGEEAGARAWSLGPAVEARLARHPTIGVDPRRLAYHGLLRDPGRRQLPEPLHSQLRQVASLFDARLVVLPLALWYRPAAPDEPVGAGEPAARAHDASLTAARAVLLLAVIDVRRSAVLWHGTIEGGVHDPASPGALTTLALRVADQLAPS